MTHSATTVAQAPVAQEPVLLPHAEPGMHELSRFGVPLGLAGLGGAWSAARGTLGSPVWPEETLYGTATALWLVLTVTYVFRGLRRKGTFRSDLKHEVAGPFASFIPLIGILLSSHYSQYLPPWGAWLCGRPSPPWPSSPHNSSPTGSPAGYRCSPSTLATCCLS